MPVVEDDYHMIRGLGRSGERDRSRCRKLYFTGLADLEIRDRCGMPRILRFGLQIRMQTMHFSFLANTPLVHELSPPTERKEPSHTQWDEVTFSW